MYSGLGHEDRGNAKICHPDARRRQAMTDKLHQESSMADEGGDLEVPRGLLLGIYQMGIPAT
jgi:hypothetical protein